ncbi:hypothetical protein [Actinomadura sp. 3N508]|uniref:hypothetical protein n=1 Tax=Actinomadura sp. 3N508 TaxID=3375153 RepID=UPI00379BB461
MIRNSRRMVTLAVAGAVAIAPVITGCGAGQEPQSAAPTQLTEGVNVSVPLDKPADPQIALRNVFLLAPPPDKPISAGSSLALYGMLINQVKGRQDRLVSVTSPLFGTAKIDGGGLALPGAAPDGVGAPVNLLGKPSKPATPPAAPPAGNQTTRPGTTPSGQPQDGATPQPTGGGATPAPTGTGATPEPTGAGATPARPTGPAQQSAAPTTPDGRQALVVLTGLKQELLASARVPVQMLFEKAGTVEFQVPIVSQQDEYKSLPLAEPVPQAPGSPTPGGATHPSTPPASPGHGSPEPGATQSPGAGAGGGESPGGSGGH